MLQGGNVMGRQCSLSVSWYIQMNQRFLTNFSLVVIKYSEGEGSFSMGNASFLRSEIFLSGSQNESSFENYLFYAETEPSAANYDFKVTIEFHQEVLFRHRLSNKYLAYSVEYQDDHNDSTVKLTLSDKPCYFKIAPCFQYQTKISPKVKLNEDVYLATELNSTKLAYVAVEQGDTGNHLRTLLSLSGRSKLILHAYSELEKEETGYVYGQAVWLKHVESNAFATVVRPEGEQEIEFEAVDMEDAFQSINGLWLIESIKTENGSNLNYSEPFYFKSLATQRYLSFEKDARTVAGEKVYKTALLERPCEQSRFMFESLKGEESKIRKGSYLILRHCLSGAFLGCRHATKPDAFHFPLLTFSEFEDEDLFDLIELKTSEEEAMRFIFSVKKELQYIDRVLEGKAALRRAEVGEMGSLYRNILAEMKKLTGSVMFEQVQEELGSSIAAFCRHLNQIRARFARGEGAALGELSRSVYEILRMICRNYKDNQATAYYFLQCFVEDVFTDWGAEELISQLFLNNYSLLCKVPNALRELRGCNLVNAIFGKVAHGDKSGEYWTRITKLFDLLEVLLHHREETIDINQRLISTELFEDGRFSQLFFEVRVFNQRIRMLHPDHLRWVEIEQLREARFLRIIERIFKLLAQLCCNRNFISKQYVDRYLNATNQEGVQTVISYLNIPISPALSNYLFSLVTNCYIDSSPRLDRHKPLAVLAFALPEHTPTSNSSDLPDDGIREGLLDRTGPPEKYLTRAWSISNMLEDMASDEPKLNEVEFELYKEELEVRLREGDWSQELLRAVCILIKLESFTSKEIQDMSRMLSDHLLADTLPTPIVASIMDIFQELTTHSLELELKKVTAFLKYRFASPTGSEFSENDVKHYLCAQRIPSTRRLKPEAVQTVDMVAETQAAKKYRKEYNQLVGVVEGLVPSEKMKDKLLGMFIESDAQTPFSVLSAVFKTMLDFYSPRLQMVRLLARSIVLTHEEVESFEGTYRFYKKVKHLTSVAEHWLSESGPSKQSKEYCYLLLQFNNFLYDGYSLNAEQNRRFRKTAKLSINRQLLVLNLSVHEVVLDLLNSNFYLLELKERHEVPAKIREVFEVSFEFLFDFCRNCQQGLEAVVQRLETVERYRELAEVGQTKLLILIFREWPNLVKQVKPALVEKVIAKILRIPTAPSSPVASRPSGPADRDCEYNPEYLEFLNTICFSQGKVYKKNLEVIFRVIDKESVLKRLLFAGKEGLLLDPKAFRSAPLQVPILYHKQLMRLLALLLQHLEYSSSAIKLKARDSVNLESLLRVMALPDIYSHRGAVGELYFLLKKEAMALLTLFLDKSDSLLRLYESEALGALLDHYAAIFLAGRERQTLPCDNEVQFLSFLEQYAGEVKYDLGNQRDYFTTQVQPLLARLLQLFERYGKREGSRNYGRLVALVEGVVAKELPQDHLLRRDTYGIDLVQLKWRNFINADQENSPEQKFLKKTLLELLRHPTAYDLLKQEREHFFARVRAREEEYLAMMGRLIAQASAEEGGGEQSQASRGFFHELIRSLAQYLVWSRGEGERRGWQGRELAETLIGYLTREEFEYNHTTSRKTFYEILRILVFLLEHDHEGALARDFHKLLSRGSSFRFFNSLREAVGEVSERIVGELAHEQINDALSELYVCGEERRCEIDRQALRFLTLLCRHPPFTDLLRSQPFNASTDFLDKIYNSFYFLVKRTQTAALTLNVAVVGIAEELLDCVQAMLNGCNQANQNYVIDNKFPEVVVEALKMEAIHQQRNLAELARRDRLTEEVCGFYLANGINVASLVGEKLQLMDFQHGYLLNRFKYSLLKLALQTVLANERGLSKLRILLPIELLKINLIWIYEDFKREGVDYNEQSVLRALEPWSEVVREKELPSNFLMIGFFYFQLIEHNNQVEREAGEDEADTAASEEKEKQKIIRKFFSSISEKQKNDERMKSLEREPFAEEMKLFYNKYYEAYEFFSKRTATIEANVFGNLVQLFFPVIPLCHKITDRMHERLLQEAQRISHEEKIKSLIAFEQETFDFLQGEEDYFREMDKRSHLVGRVAKLVQNEDSVYLFVWAMSVLIVLGYLLDDFATPEHSFQRSFATYLAPNTLVGFFILLCSLVNLACGCLLLVNVIIRKVPFLLRLYEYKYLQELQQEGQMQEGLAAYQAKHVLSAAFFDLYCIGCSILTIMHPLFAGFLLVYIVKRIELGKTIVRAIEETWFSLFVAAALLIVFNYIFSILIYCASFTSDVGYGTTCQTLFTCLLMLVDQSLKAGSGFLATNASDFTYMTLNFKVIAEIMYILFAQKVIFEIFSGTIIDKFGELREEGDSTKEDEESTCYICGQERFQIDFELEGFEQHVRKTHNKLNYIYFLFYIRRKARAEYGVEDNFIWDAHARADNDWIPDGTSLQKIIKQREEAEDAHEEKAIEEYEKYFHKKLQEFKKLHVKVENLSGLLKEDNLFA